MSSRSFSVIVLPSAEMPPFSIAGHFGDQHRAGVILIVEVPRPAIPELVRDGGEPHVGVMWIQGVELLRPDEGRHFALGGLRLRWAAAR